MPEADLMTADEAAPRLKLHPVSLRIYCGTDPDKGGKGWPHRRRGRRMFWTEADLAEIIRLMEQPAVQPRRRRRTA